jgi:hypothetical protein
VRLTDRRIDQFGSTHDRTSDRLGKLRLEDGYGPDQKCMVPGDVESALRLDFVSKTRAEQNLDAISALLPSLIESLVSP